MTGSSANNQPGRISADERVRNLRDNARVLEAVAQTAQYIQRENPDAEPKIRELRHGGRYGNDRLLGISYPMPHRPGVFLVSLVDGSRWILEAAAEGQKT